MLIIYIFSSQYLEELFRPFEVITSFLISIVLN